jgi:hypothetical protein
MREAAGAKTLIDLLKSEFNIEVEYSPKNGIVSVQVPGEDRAVAFLGSTAVTLNKLCTHLKASPQKVLSDGIERLFKAHQEHDRTGKYPILNHKTGKLELKKISLRELRRHCKAEVERFDEEDEDNLDYDDRPL